MLAAALSQLLTRTVGGAVVVRSVTPLSGGASSATFAVDAERDGAAWPLIFQRAEGSVGMPKRAQAELQRVAGNHGVPVAAVVAVAADDDALGDGFVMERVEGESLAPRWLKGEAYAAARAAMTGQCAVALAAIHRIAPDACAGLGGGSGQNQHAALFDLYRGFGVDEPAFDLAFAWLRARMTDAPARVVCHGDFRSGNFIVVQYGLAAVLDWELAHFGDHHADLAWLCVNAWRFGHWQKPVGGFGERADLYAAYEKAGGRAVDPALAHIWEVFGTLRWGMSCLQLVDDHRSGRVRSVERAAIGRRVSEVAADLLWLIEHGTI